MKPPIFSPFSSIIQTCLQTIEDRAQCITTIAETTRQDRRSWQQFRRYENSPTGCLAFESLPAQQRRSTLCQAELDRMDSLERFSESDFDEKMLFEQSIRRSVSMNSGGKLRPCRGLVRGCMYRFVSKVFDDLRFRDVLWRSAAFSMYNVEERRRFGFPEKERRSQEDRWGLGSISLDGRLLNAESATSVERIGGHFSCEEALAWERFSPFQRVLIVAIAAAAAANSKRGDQALNFMRCKLNNLSERISSRHDQSGNARISSLCDQSGNVDQNRKSDDGIIEHKDYSSIVGLRNAGGCETCGQGFNDGSRNWKGKTGDAEKIPSTHAPCAAAILELKRRIGNMIEKEASNVMAAFASVLEKVEALKIYGSTQDGRQNKAQGVTLGDFKITVEKTSAQITSLQMSLYDIWHVLLPEALCTINISPSELEHYLDKAKKENCMLLPSRQFNIQAWRQWLNMQEHASEATFIPVLQDETEEDASVKMLLTVTEQEECRLSDLSDWSSSVTSSSDNNIWHSAEADVPSAIGSAVKGSMDKLTAPLDAENSPSNGDSQELVVEKSLGKLEIASAKVANLELQLASLKEHLKLCEKNRKDAEEQLAEAVKQGIKNQLNFAAKEEEIACLRKQCKQKDATIKEITLAVQKSKDTKRLAISEDICKKKNAMIMRFKDDMVAMEEKVNTGLRKENKQKYATIKEITLAQKSNDTSFKRLAISEDICKKKNATIVRLKDDMVAMEEKVSELKRLLTPLSSKCNGENKQKYATIKEITLAQKSKDTNFKRLAISEDICKKKNATIMRLKDDMVATEEKVSELKRLLTPLSSKCNGEYSLPLVISYNPLFDMDIPSSLDSPRKVLGLKTSGDQYVAANEYVSSSSQGYNETQQRSSGQSSTSSHTYGKFRRNSTGTQAHEITKLGSSSPRKVKSFRSGSVLSGLDTNADLRSRRSSSDGEGLWQNTRNSQISKSKDMTRRKSLSPSDDVLLDLKTGLVSTPERTGQGTLDYSREFLAGAPLLTPMYQSP